MVETFYFMVFLLGNAVPLMSGNDQIECGVPGSPAFGFFQPLKERYDVGERVSYDCTSGWLLGDYRRICGSDGRWNGSVPVCVSAAKISKSVQIESAHWNPTTRLNFNNQSSRFLDDDEVTCTGQFVRQGLRLWIDFSNPATLIGVKFTFDTREYLKFQVFTEHSIGEHSEGMCFDTVRNTIALTNKSFRTSLQHVCYSTQAANGIIVLFDARNENESVSLCEVTFFPVPNDSKCVTPDTPSQGNNKKIESLLPHITYSYSCDSATKLVGPNETTCHPNRTWSNEAPVCMRELVVVDIDEPLLGGQNNATHPDKGKPNVRHARKRIYHNSFGFGIVTGALAILLLVGIVFLVYFLRRKKRSNTNSASSLFRSSSQRSNSFNVSFHRNRVEQRRSSGNNYAVAFSKHPAAASAGQQRDDDDDHERPPSDIPDLLDNNGGVRIRGLTNSAIGHIYADPVYYETPNAVRPEQQQRPPHIKMAENEVYSPNT